MKMAIANNIKNIRFFMMGKTSASARNERHPRQDQLHPTSNLRFPAREGHGSPPTFLLYPMLDLNSLAACCKQGKINAHASNRATAPARSEATQLVVSGKLV